MDITYHYPPELLNLLIDTIPLLCRSKRDVITFFRGAGVSINDMKDMSNRVKNDRKNISKYEITRTILIRLNEKGEIALGERRELLKRVIEFENFSACWADDMLKAKGLVADVRQIVNIKDAFTRMNLEREAERKKRKANHLDQQNKLLQKKAKTEELQKEFYALFNEKIPIKEGRSLRAF